MRFFRITGAAKALAIAAIATVLAGCGDEKSESKNQASHSTPERKSSTQSAPAGDPATRLDAYKELSKGEDLMAHYFRLSGMPDDLSDVANYHYPAYQQEHDAFKKRDLLAQFKNSIQTRVDAAKQGPYVLINLPEYASIGKGALGSYDFDKKAFHVGYFEKEKVYKSSRYDNPYATKSKDTVVDVGTGLAFQDNNFSTLYFSNWKDFEYLTVADEAMARDLEGKRNKYRTSDNKGLLQVRIYAFINELVGNRVPPHLIAQNAVSAQIMKLQLLDQDGKVLAEK